MCIIRPHFHQHCPMAQLRLHASSPSLLPGLWPIANATAQPMAYSIRRHQAHGLSRTLLPGLWPTAAAAAKPAAFSATGSAAATFSGVSSFATPFQQQPSVRTTAFNTHCCLAYGLYHALLRGLCPIAYAAARPMAYSIHCCQAYGLRRHGLPSNAVPSRVPVITIPSPSHSQRHL